MIITKLNKGMRREKGKNGEEINREEEKKKREEKRLGRGD